MSRRYARTCPARIGAIRASLEHGSGPATRAWPRYSLTWFHCSASPARMPVGCMERRRRSCRGCARRDESVVRDSDRQVARGWRLTVTHYQRTHGRRAMLVDRSSDRCGEHAADAQLAATPRRHLATRRSHSFAGQLAGLLHPSGELSFVELVVLVDVEVAHFLLLGLAGGDGTQRRAAEESHLDVLREAMEAEEPALALDAVEAASSI